jgi:uncharacterized lipoprotein YbaY
MRTVHGGVVLTPGLGPFRHATLRVRLLDVSRADAPATQLGEVVVPAVDYDATTDVVVPFEVGAPDWDPRSSVTVSAHLDRSGDGDVVAGDALTTQHYEVGGQGEGDRVLVRLTAVGT